LSIRRDVLPVAPFLAAGLPTAWLEANVVGTTGAEYALPWLERVLLAGRVIWFYAARLLWPAQLTFFFWFLTGENEETITRTGTIRMMSPGARGVHLRVVAGVRVARASCPCRGMGFPPYLST
jgi:hypothetical protein